VLERTGLPAPWRAPLVALFLVIAATLLLFHQTVAGMVGIWSRSDTYAHGFVVPFISLWLIWRMRHQLAPLVPTPSALAWVMLLAAVLVWFAGDLVAVNAVTQLMLVVVLVLLVPALLGWQVALSLVFPLAFLFFAVPIGDFLLPQLMTWTADFTVIALRWTGIPVYREGLQFVIPSGTWSVVEACSGIRYLIASLTVGCLFAYLSFNSPRKRLVFVLVAMAVPLMANWLRAYLIVLLGHLSGNELATGVDHLIYGWLFFGIVIFVMLLIGSRFADAPIRPVATVASPNTLHGPLAQPGLAQSISVVAVLLLLAVPTGLGMLLAAGNRDAPVRWASFDPPAPWTPTAEKPSTWTPAFEHPTAQWSRGFATVGQPSVGLDLSYYRQQNYERKLVSSANTLVHSKDENWARVEAGSAEAVLAGEPLVVGAETLREKRAGMTASASQRLRAWRFYWVNDQFTASDVRAKLQGALSQISGRGDDGAIVVVYTAVNEGLPAQQAQEQADQRLRGFLEAAGAPLLTMLRQTRGGH
jgi:exosortase A